MRPIDWTDLPGHERARKFEGADHGTTHSGFISRNPPGTGASLHRHPYPETFIVEAGESTFTVGEERVTVTAGHLIVVPANTWHGFVSSGDEMLHQVSIHPSERVIQENAPEEWAGRSLDL
jgi:quercetin dioxygenase-like cupin family protein